MIGPALFVVKLEMAILAVKSPMKKRLIKMPGPLDRTPQKRWDTYSWHKILIISILILLFLYWVISSMYAPYYANYLIGGI